MIKQLESLDAGRITELDDLPDRFRRAILRFSRVLRQQRVDTSVPLSQLSALGTVLIAGPMSPGELAMRERVQPPTMTRILAKLEDAGLVTRTPHPTDGRGVLVSATAAGSEFVLRERSARTQWLAVRLDELDAADQAVLAHAAQILERLAHE